MKTLEVPKSLEGKIPQEFLDLPDDATYRLTKVLSKNTITMVGTGRSVSGSLCLVDVKKLGLLGIRVSRGFDYIRTSPITKVLTSTENGVVFETEGGVYVLERLEQ
jgi:hypothetical protein